MAVALLQIALALVFVAAGAMKCLDQNGTRRAVRDFGAPGALVVPAAATLPALEFAMAGALLVPATARVAAAGMAVLLAAFSIAIAGALVRGRAPECHCFGARSGRVGPRTLLRNTVLAAVAIALLATHARLDLVAWIHRLGGEERIGLAAAVVLAAVIAGFSWLVAILLRREGRLLLRLEALEGAAGGRLPIVLRAPAFSVRDVDGASWSLGDLRGAGRAVLLVFVDARCRACDAVLPRVAAWQRDRGDRLTVAVVGTGSEPELRAKRGQHGLGLVLVDTAGVSASYGVEATPAAVLIDRDGSIGAPTAHGEEEIARLAAVGAPVPAVGDPAPAIALSGPTGERVALESGGRPTLVVFWDPSCAACDDVAGDLRAWDTEPATRLLVVSRGDPDRTRGLGLRTPVGLDPGDATALAYGARGTPSAVLVDGRGMLASPIAEGREAMLELAGRSAGAVAAA